MANDSEYDHRRVYARGYYNGLKAAEKAAKKPDNEGESMSTKRLTSIKNGLTGIAAKVYDAVPISEPWPAPKIRAEMIRRGNGINTEMRLIDGCLKSLVSDHLIIEPSRGEFVRVPERNTEPKVAQVMEFADTTKKPKPEIQAMPAQTLSLATSGRTAIEKLSALSARAIDLSGKVVALSEDIDAAAVEIEDMMKQHAEDSAKLKQLQALLKGLG